MKRIAIIAAVILLLASAVLAACGKTGESSAPAHDISLTSEYGASSAEGSSAPEADESYESSAEESSEQPEQSEPIAEVSGSESSADSEYEGEEINLLYASYSEKPYYAIVGTCAQGATITARSASGTEYTSESFYGWFSVRVKCESTPDSVSLTQSAGGKQLGNTRVFSIKPVTPSSEMWPIITGKNMQFFLQKMLPDFRGTNLPSADTLSRLTTRVRNRVNDMRSYNPKANIIYLIVPSAMTTCPELVPEEYAPAAGKTRLDLVLDAINASGAYAVDLRPVFAAHKDDERPLTYKTDSHWTDYAAYLAYKEIFDYISKDYPAAAPRPDTDFNWNPGYYESGDMTYYLAMSQTEVREYEFYRTFNFTAPNAVTKVTRYRRPSSLVYSDASTEANTIRTDRPELPSCYVLRDSFSAQIYDILAERMDTTYYSGMWDHTWKQSFVMDNQPDYVIYILSEWNIDAIING